MRTDELDYHLPPERIATEPATPRDSARLMRVDRASGQVAHRHVRDLPQLGILQPGDLMVFNQSKVLPASFHAVRKDTGGRVGGLFLGEDPEGGWQLLIESRGKLAEGERILLGESGELELVERQGGGQWRAALHSPLGTLAVLERIGHPPLPPYIRKARKAGGRAEFDPADTERYNTVYADAPGSVAAPTAGLHFTPELLAALDQVGVRRAFVTLHVGMGTFAPVRTERVEDHPMHREWVSIPAQTIRAIHETRAAGRRILVVGTTSVRALESLPDPLPTNPVKPFVAQTGLFITPGFNFRFTDMLMTNFHLPRSTLLMLAAALPQVGLPRLLAWYQTAIDHGYRFYSYGDAMLLA